MPISWNEIRQNAIRFSREWSEEHREDAEAKSFWDEFFAVFGIRRRLFATFEEPVKKINGQYGYIDVFWRGLVLAEHKSRGKSLDKAESQAFSYIQDLAREQRLADLPRYVILSDFENIALYDLEPDEQLDLPLFESRHYRKIEFPLSELHKRIQQFAFIAGYKQHRLREEDPINIKAVEILGDLHDVLADGGYKGHDLERFLVRVLFCLFADDTGLFEPDTFKLYVEDRTAKDGSDLGMHLAQLFEVLDLPPDRRQANLDEMLAAFPHVNGELFKERLAFANFNRAMRDALVTCTQFNWSKISPAIFGSLFQGVMEPKERRQTGGHYTSEQDILKVINALFMDDLRTEFEKARRSKAMLKQFHEKIGNLRFFDPACGCGNFLVITYRELRLLEIEILKELLGKNAHLELDIQVLSRVDVDAFTGIEIQEWPARIAEVAMWLMEHQMNLRLSETFGQYFVRLPLMKSANIVLGNALRLDWKMILPPDHCSYVLGNPPFVGKHLMTSEQTGDMELLWKDTLGAGILDYVTGWYKKAAEYIRSTAIVVGFVSTSSITQGEQVGVLWNTLFQRYGIKIHFGHRTFAWQSEARGKARVHVVIIGFANFDVRTKKIYEYESDGKTGAVYEVANVSPYLLEGPDVAVITRTNPICNVPSCIYGNKPTDGGHLIVEEKDRVSFLLENPAAKKYLRPLLCAEEYLHSIPRWCLWLIDAAPKDILNIQGIKQRVEAVRAFRLASKKEPTRKKADFAALFAEIRQPKSRYIVIPRHSSEHRKYVPFGYFDPTIVIHDSCTALPNASLYHFGVLSSAMHMAWMRQVCGRLESRYRYSSGLVYNNFPWPTLESGSYPESESSGMAVRETDIGFLMTQYDDDAFVSPTSKQNKKSLKALSSDDKKKAVVEKSAQAVLNVRAKYTTSTLADLYDPLSMPSDLVKAHAELDRAVDQCYRSAPFTSDRQRIEFLFALYEQYTAPLLPAEKKKTRK
ncbi:MAG: DNA methyltransferase [bacterium]